LFLTDPVMASANFVLVAQMPGYGHWSDHAGKFSEFHNIAVDGIIDRR